MSLRKIASFPPQSDRVWCAAAHPRLPLLATASADRVVRLYSLRDFTQTSIIEGGHKRSIRSVAWKPHTKNQSILATGSFDSTTGIWHRDEDNLKDQSVTDETLDLDSAEREEDDEWRFAVVLDGHDSEVKSVAWSAGGTFLATCSRDKSVWVWEEMDEDNYETIAVLQEHTQDVKMVVWHPEEELLASASYDDTIRLYKEDVDDWVCCSVLTGHTSTVWAISFENAGSKSRLASASDDQTARIWFRKPKPLSDPSKGVGQPSILRRSNDEVEDWEEQSVLPKAHDRTIYSIDWSKKTGMIVTSGGDGKIVVYKEDNPLQQNSTDDETEDASSKKTTSWRIVAQIEAAHSVFEINSVTWCKRWDRNRRNEDEEVLVSTGDDGIVNVFEVNV